jgi:hypothetical protein
MARKVIPVILTEADWQRQKGAFAKMAGKTGVSEAMKKMKAAFDAVDWDKFDPDAAMAGGGALDTNKLDVAFGEAKKEHPKVELVRKALYELRDVAQKTSARFKANKLIPAASTQHAANVAKAAEHFAVELKSMDVLFENKKKEILTKIAEYRKLLHTQIANLEKGLQTIKQNPTKGVWKTAMHQQIRGLNAQISIQADTKQFVSQMTPYSADGFVVGVDYKGDINKEKQDILAKAKLVEGLCAKIKSAVV